MNKSQQGFTLLEIIIALFIFTILAVLSMTALETVISARESTDSNAKQLSDMQMAIVLLQRDLQQVTDRKIRNSAGKAQAAFLGTESSIEFTRAGFFNPINRNNKSSDILRVAYQAGAGLNRVTWPTLDQAPNTQPNTRNLLPAQSSRFRFYDKNQRAYDSWPPEQGASDSDIPATFPNAIEIRLDMDAAGTMDFFIYIPAQTVTEISQANNNES